MNADLAGQKKPLDHLRALGNTVPFPTRKPEETDMPRSIAAACAAFTLALSVVADGRAQDTSYPNAPVKLLIGFPPGGLLDTVSRIVGERMSALLGQPFVVDARPGAGGLIAT